MNEQDDVARQRAQGVRRADYLPYIQPYLDAAREQMTRMEEGWTLAAQPLDGGTVEEMAEYVAQGWARERQARLAAVSYLACWNVLYRMLDEVSQHDQKARSVFDKHRAVMPAYSSARWSVHENGAGCGGVDPPGFAPTFPCDDSASWGAMMAALQSGDRSVAWIEPVNLSPDSLTRLQHIIAEWSAVVPPIGDRVTSYARAMSSDPDNDGEPLSGPSR